ncbi:MAG: DUF3310 domain-containing protein [Shouchella clausii]|jgi:hypothetical protein
MNRPKHYEADVDPLAYMKMHMSAAGYEGFLIGNVIKYVTRYPKKNGLEDLKKARDYLNKTIELYEEGEKDFQIPGIEERTVYKPGIRIGDES